MKRREVLLAVPALMTSGVPAWAKESPGAGAPFKFGISASLTGGQAAYGKEIRDGILAAFAAADKDKGISYELVTLDDGGHKDKCKANVKTLIDGGVLALVGITSGAAAEAATSLAEQAQVVMLGTASGNMGIRSDSLTMAYHVRAGYNVEYQQMVKYVKSFGFSRVGYVYLKDASPANQAAMNAALDAAGLKPVIAVSLDRNSNAFDAEADALLAAKLNCVIFTSNAGPIEKIITRMAAADYRGTYFSSSFAGQPLINAMTAKGISVIMSQVVPRPNAVALPLVKRYQTDLTSFSGANAKYGYTSLEGYIVGRVAMEAARVAAQGGGVSRPRFKSALSDMNWDLGGYRVQFGGNNRQSSKYVDVVAIDRTGRIIG
jgi:branched-chain amino acid transport system substrate-binding protein